MEKETKLIYGVGYLGVGEYKTMVKTVRTKDYLVWRTMIMRCYDERYHKTQPTYGECSVVEEWHNFQNFGSWCEHNYIDGFVLDKDILVKGNKIYSPETCCFVPQEINNLFTNRKNKRGKYPIGVNTKGDKFRATMTLNKKQLYIGTFTTIQEAFEAYKLVKEQHIKEVADKWRGKITEEVYKAMYNYKVEITD